METRTKTPLRARREELEMTQEELESLSGVGQSGLSVLERGEWLPSLPVAVRLARALDTTVEALWGDAALATPTTTRRRPKRTRVHGQGCDPACVVDAAE